MAVICPTVTAYDERSYDYQLNNIAKFVRRIHLDFMDGNFTPKNSPELSYAKWPVGVKADIHLMYQYPNDYIDELIRLRPDMVIVHAETEGSFYEIVQKLKTNNIKTGLALLKPTPVSLIEPVLDDIDHVLIFSGDLGSFGGHADLSLLLKVEAVKVINPNIEIGWDGGVDEQNVEQLVDGGVDVINVGGFIQRSDNPARAYARLESLAQGIDGGKQTNN